MERVWGYARISTQLQNLERQVRNILAFDPSAEIIQETYSGRNASRPKFQKLLKCVQAGDTIIFDSVSRMSRNAAEGINLYKELYNKGVKLIFLKERHIDTETYRKELNKQIDLRINTGEQAADELFQTIIDALNTLQRNKYVWPLNSLRKKLKTCVKEQGKGSRLQEELESRSADTSLVLKLYTRKKLRLKSKSENTAGALMGR